MIATLRNFCLFAALLSLAPGLLFAQELGEDLTRRDRTAILYSTKLGFTNEHIPVVTVLIMDSVERATIRSEKPIIFLPEGEGGARVSVGRGETQCTVSLEGGRPARIRYWVALARLHSGDMEGIRRARAEWESKGLSVRAFERGSVFGFYGRVLDNRVTILVEDRPFDDLKAALARRDALAGDSGLATLEVFEEAVERPKGLLKVSCKGIDTDLLVPDVVFAEASSGALIRVLDVEYGRGFPWHSKEDRLYRGRLVFTVDRSGRLAVINAVDVETLLKGLVPSEIYVDAPLEALKAQAVCARGELFAKLGTRHTADPFMICSDVHCQVYRGAGRENPRTSKAVDETRGLMLVVKGQGGEDAKAILADTVYGASCGGHTEDGGEVWQGSGHAYLKGLPDGPDGLKVFSGERPTEEEVRNFIRNPPQGLYCGSTKFGQASFRWTKEVQADEIRRGVKEVTGKDVGEVLSLVPLERGSSGRITRIRVEGRAGEVEISPELSIRKAFGGLKSSLFIVTAREGPSGRKFKFEGAGFGHGVGMCQVGAIGMAEKGKDFKEILMHYFPGTELLKIY